MSAVPKPQLATLKQAVPRGSRYIHEVKYDGYRTMAKLEKGEAKLFTRNSHDWTHRYPLIVQAFEKSPVTKGLGETILDGEMVCLDEEGKSDFTALKKSLGSGGDHQSMRFIVFDAHKINGEEIAGLGQETRKKLLKHFLEKIGDPRIIYSDHFSADGEEVYQQCCQLGLEGIVSKDADAPYESGRNLNWIKIKCEQRDEFPVIGYVPKENIGGEIAALIVASFEDGKLKEIGKVGTGFNQKKRQEIYRALKVLETPTPAAEVYRRSKSVKWVEPVYLARIKYLEITSSKKLRHASFVSLEKRHAFSSENLQNAAKEAPFTEAQMAHMITSPDKVVYQKAQVTKKEIASYYNEVYSFMAPHLLNKLLTLIVCPEGQGKKCYFAKHAGLMKNLQTVELEQKGKKDDYIYINNRKGLIYMARYNALEIHTWNVRAPAVKTPVEMIFDLDPSEGIEAKDVIDSAFEVKETLERLGLVSFPKLTGGKGIHVHTPIAPMYGKEDIYQLSKSIAFLMEEENPKRFTTNMRLDQRDGKIFVDYLRNGLEGSYICAFSPRRNELATVSTPATWRELKSHDLKDPVTLKAFTRQLKNYRDPWSDYWEMAQEIKIFQESEGNQFL